MEESSVLLVIIVAILGIAATGFWNDKRRAEAALERAAELIGTLRERVAAAEAKIELLLRKEPD